MTRKDLILDKNTTIDSDLNCGNIRGKNGMIYNLKVNGNIDAADITAGNIVADNIDAGNIKAKNIDAIYVHAGWVNAENIKVADIIATNIKAKNIRYYSVCIAHGNIVCDTIKGADDKAVQLALHGTITTKHKTSQRAKESDII
ncbi:MAG: hypothetical protein QW478_08845 [Candidatus Micrarchaeaceae archaeon]